MQEVKLTRKAAKTAKRIAFIDAVTEVMLGHEFFNGLTKRQGDTENQIQKSLFLRLYDRLPKIIEEKLGYSSEEATDLTKTNFKFEQNTKTIVNNFTSFATGHRPDAIIDLSKQENFRIAIEIKKGSSGNAIRSGIGQSVVYSAEFDFVIYFFVDTTLGGNILSSAEGIKESHIINSLWDNYNVKLIFV